MPKNETRYVLKSALMALNDVDVNLQLCSLELTNYFSSIHMPYPCIYQRFLLQNEIHHTIISKLVF